MAVIVVMGVSGCGKSSVGVAIAHQLNVPFIDGDTLHPPENIRKMTSGVPLSDDDRWPWLERIRHAMHQLTRTDAPHPSSKAHSVSNACAMSTNDRMIDGVIACSALKKTYRCYLAIDHTVQFVYLKVDLDVVLTRVTQRHREQGHFMHGREMIMSQYAALEEPADGAEWCEQHGVGWQVRVLQAGGQSSVAELVESSLSLSPSR